ncbi:MAG: hypothetical protein PHW79_08380 [Candidatus Marinimicrobia bacterium]|nr:hypothetical protein [Candidatus Neomarinimicrobiota bacterium]
MNRNIKIVLLIFTFVLVWNVGAFTQTAPRHVGVSIHENMINAFFDSIGPVTGTGKKADIKYEWTVIHPQVDIEPGIAHFYAKVKVEAGVFKTTEDAKGQVDIQYIRDTNRIRIQVREANVKLFFRLFGKEIPIGTIDIAKYYRPAFEFAGPQPIQKEISIDLPDGTIKSMSISTTNETLLLEQDKVSVYSDLVFTPIDSLSTK